MPFTLLISQEQELLDKEKASKRRLEEANRIIRDQASQPGPPLPPPRSASNVPAAQPPPGIVGMEPAAKRMRMDGLPPGPPPPPMTGIPPPTTTVFPPPPSQAPNQAATGMEPSQNPMADARLPSNPAMVMESAAPTKTLLSEADFRDSLSKPEVTLQIRIPNDPSQMAWNFYGQILSLSVNVMSKVKEVKADLSRLHLNGMPVNKMQFKDTSAGFLSNNNQSLAALNIGPTATLELIPKTRGGRR